jgi:hypothetical protein
MQRKFFAVLILSFCATPATTVRAESSDHEYKVRHDHTLGSCEGKLAMSDREIRYEASDGKHSQSWSYLDIQKLDIASPTRLTLKTFKSANWNKLGKDKTFGFSLIEGQLTAGTQEFLRSKLSRPMVARLTESKVSRSAAFALRHRHRVGGCEGDLQVEGDRLVYSTDRANDNRVWKLSEIETIGSPDPYHFRVTTYNETFTFDLKSPLDSNVYDSLWKKIYRLESTQAFKRELVSE